LEKKKEIKELEEMIEIVLLRIPREIEARNFYMSAAKKTNSEMAKELFINLSQQEQGHEAELRRILKHLQGELHTIKTGHPENGH